MELKTKKQYSYLIYPYVINEKEYDKYIYKLLKNRHCELKIWDKKEDLNLYTYFSKNIKESVFWSFSYNDGRKEKLNDLDRDFRSKILAQNQAVTFEYKIGENAQGKIGKDLVFFGINKMEIICFKTGICFVVMKTSLGDSANFDEILNANSKFRNIRSDFKTAKENESIIIQIEEARDILDLSEIIKDIVGNNKDAKSSKICEERILTYSYTCFDKNDWNNDSDYEDKIKKEFVKYYKVLPESFPDKELKKENDCTIDLTKFLKVGFSKQGTGIICSNENPENELNTPYVFEQEYLYTYILSLYKKLYVNKIYNEFGDCKKFDQTKEKLEKFTNEIWVQPITERREGISLYRKWENPRQLNYLLEKLKLDMRLENNMNI